MRWLLMLQPHCIGFGNTHQVLCDVIQLLACLYEQTNSIEAAAPFPVQSRIDKGITLITGVLRYGDHWGIR